MSHSTTCTVTVLNQTLVFLLPGPLLVCDSSVIGGSASSWIVGTDASRPGTKTQTVSH